MVTCQRATSSPRRYSSTRPSPDAAEVSKVTVHSATATVVPAQSSLQPGTLMGPDALRTAGIGRILGQLGFAVEDHGNMTPSGLEPAEGSPPTNAKFYGEIKGWIRALSKRSFLLARSGAVPIFMGGDHSLSMGSVNGVARHWRKGRPLFVLWLDAHADYNTPQTTETGNMHGMSAAFLCGEPGLDRLLGKEPRAAIGPDQLDLFGIR